MCSLEESGSMGRVGLYSCTASTLIVVTKAGVSSESLPHSQNGRKSLRISGSLRLSILFLILGVLAMQFGTATLLGVIWGCRLRCTSDGVVLGPAWASDVVLILVLVWASDVVVAWMSDAFLIWTSDLGVISCCSSGSWMSDVVLSLSMGNISHILSLGDISFILTLDL